MDLSDPVSSSFRGYDEPDQDPSSQASTIAFAGAWQALRSVFRRVTYGVHNECTLNP